MRTPRPRSLLLALLALLTGAAACSNTRPEGEARFELDLPAQAQNLAGGPIAAALVHEDAQVSVNLVRIAAPLAPHRHLQSEELVYLLSGAGTLRVGRDSRELRAGDFAVVPRNTPHSFTPAGDAPTVVLQFFAPPFVEGDRVLEPPGQ